MYYCRVLFLSVVCAGSLLTLVRAADVAVQVGPGTTYSPRNVTIDVNDRVVWTWVGSIHTATHSGNPRLWDSGLRSTGTFDRVFTTIGTFNYYCTVPGHLGYGQSGSVTVQGGNTPPTVTITNPVNDAVFVAPATFTAGASASDTDGSVSQVQFFLDAASLGTDTVSPYSANVNNLAAGTYRLSAVATDNQSARATNSITVTVNAGPPTFSDVNWTSIEGIESPGGQIQVQAAVVDGLGNFYIGGFFRTSGDVFATDIAKWNGSDWSPLGSGMTNVSELAVSGSDLYAAGWFKRAGGIPAENVAKWDGTNWSALGSGVNNIVRALAVSGSNVYAGGDFLRAGGTPANYVAKWDGNTWSALGAGMSGRVRALAVSGSDLYAASEFSTAGSPVANLYKWDGSSWSVLGPGINSLVLTLAVSGSDVYAGGSFGTAGGSQANRIVKWNGSSWSPLGSGLGGGDVWGLAVSGNDVYAAGTFTTAGGSPANFIAKWDGTTWSPLGSGMNDDVFALAISGSSLYAAGSFTTAGGKVSVGVAKARIGSSADSITASGSSAVIQFSGVVGYEYHVQRTDTLTPPITWTMLTPTPLSPAADGSLTFIDTNAPPGTAYYRLKQN